MHHGGESELADLSPYFDERLSTRHSQSCLRHRKGKVRDNCKGPPATNDNAGFADKSASYYHYYHTPDGAGF